MTWTYKIEDSNGNSDSAPEIPGIAQEILFMFLIGLIYQLLLVTVEYGGIRRIIWNLLCKTGMKRFKHPVNDEVTLLLFSPICPNCSLTLTPISDLLAGRGTRKDPREGAAGIRKKQRRWIPSSQHVQKLRKLRSRVQPQLWCPSRRMLRTAGRERCRENHNIQNADRRREPVQWKCLQFHEHAPE